MIFLGTSCYAGLLGCCFTMSNGEKRGVEEEERMREIDGEKRRCYV